MANVIASPFYHLFLAALSSLDNGCIFPYTLANMQ